MEQIITTFNVEFDINWHDILNTFTMVLSAFYMLQCSLFLSFTSRNKDSYKLILVDGKTYYLRLNRIDY
jgi:preprotein translocase subunit SecG